MSISPQTFIGPALGMVPHIGPFLAVGFDAETAGPSNQDIEKLITDLENEVDSISKELKAFEAKSVFLGLINSIHDAPGEINGFYKERGKTWITSALQGKPLPPITDTSYNTKIINTWLLNINTIMMGLQIGYSSWMRLWLEYQIKEHIANAPNVHQQHSLLEKAYRSFMYMVQIQIKGLLCLRAVGTDTDELAKQAYLLQKNIIQQGLHCQLVVNSFITPNDADTEAFTQIQAHNVSPSPSRNIDLHDVGNFVASGSSNPNQPITGVEFHMAQSNTAAMRLATGTLNKYGTINAGSQAWGSSAYDQAHQAKWANTFVPNGTQNINAGPGEILTGVKFRYLNEDAYSHTQILIDATPSIVNSDQSLTPQATIKQESAEATLTSIHNLAINQMSAYNLFTDSPITGLVLCVASNQICFAMETSIHQNAFSPYKIGDAPRVSLKSMNHGTLLDGDITTKSVSLQKGSVANQLLLGKQTSGDYNYGDLVTITCIGTKESLYLTGNEDSPGQHVNLAPSGQGEWQWWTLLDPDNITNKGEPIYNWSAVALQNNMAGAYLWANDITVLMDPSTVTGISGNRITDPDFVWNFSLQD
jgi:hypothetical protein|tara:strand:- start:348 stop:2117 length:1770 start_codon:yes stop_codon:yes gene_type:complete